MLSRFGPILPVEPAALKVWQLPQPAEAKTAFAGAAARRPPLCCSFTHLSKSAWETTLTGARMVAWPSPQSSVQMSVKFPVRVGVTTMLRVDPGHDVLLLPHRRDPERVDHVGRLEART